MSATSRATAPEEARILEGLTTEARGALTRLEAFCRERLRLDGPSVGRLVEAQRAAPWPSLSALCIELSEELMNEKQRARFLDLLDEAVTAQR